MSVTRKPLDLLATGTTFVLCIGWGLQQVAIKAAAKGMDPTLQVGLRSAIAALLLIIFMVFRRHPGALMRALWLPGLAVAALFGSEFLVVSLGLSHTTASHMTVFLYTAPVFTALGMHWWVAGERLRKAQWTGVALALVGVALSFSGGFFSSGAPSTLLGDGLGLLGALFWALTTVTIRATKLSDAPPSITLLYQLLGAAVMLLPLSLLQGTVSQIHWTTVVWASLVFQSVGVAFVSYLIWFWLLTVYLATPLSIFSLLTPLFGVGFGVTLLHEPLDPRFVAGAALVLVGIVLVSRPPAKAR